MFHRYIYIYILIEILSIDSAPCLIYVRIEILSSVRVVAARHLPSLRDSSHFGQVPVLFECQAPNAVRHATPMKFYQVLLESTPNPYIHFFLLGSLAGVIHPYCLPGRKLKSKGCRSLLVGNFLVGPRLSVCDLVCPEITAAFC